MTRMVQCVKLGKELPGLKFAPLPNALGQKIFDNVSQEAWNGCQMENYFFGEQVDGISGYTPPSA